MLISIKRLDNVRTIPIMTGVSRVLSAVTISFPTPFQPKIYSTKTAPASKDANHPEITVITGLSAFLIPCLKTTLKVDNPLEYAVLM